MDAWLGENWDGGFVWCEMGLYRNVYLIKIHWWFSVLQMGIIIAVECAGRGHVHGRLCSRGIEMNIKRG